MYCILTKVNDTYDLPIVWEGKSGVELAKKLGERDGWLYQSNITSVWSAEELFSVGVVKLDVQEPPAGMIETGPKAATLEGFTVVRKAPWMADPDYVTPDPVQKAKDRMIVAIKSEANRRIVAVVPEWKQRNLTAQAAQMAKQVADGTPLTAEQQAAWDAGEAIWQQVAAIRIKSDELEAVVNAFTTIADFEETYVNDEGVTLTKPYDITDDLKWV